MSDLAAMEQENDQALGRLLALGLEAAEHLQGRLLAAETDAEVATRTMAFTRAARLVRQTAALRAKLARDLAAERRAALREAEDRAADPKMVALREEVVSERKMAIRETLEEMVWREVEDDERAERLVDAIEPAVEAEARDPLFLSRSLDELVFELRKVIGLMRAPGADDDVAAPSAPEDPPASANSS